MDATSQPALVVLPEDAVRRLVREELERALAGAQATAAAAPSTDDAPAVLGQEDLARLLGISVREVQRRRKDGRIPRGTAIGPRSVRWIRTDIEAWLRAGAPRAVTPPKRRTG